MKILIDDVASVDVEPQAHIWGGPIHGTDQPELMLTTEDTSELLDAWAAIDPAHRNYRFGDTTSDEPCSIVIAYIVTTENPAQGNLVLSDVDPFWAGEYNLDGYSLEQLSAAVPMDTFNWDVTA